MRRQNSQKLLDAPLSKKSNIYLLNDLGTLNWILPHTPREIPESNPSITPTRYDPPQIAVDMKYPTSSAETNDVDTLIPELPQSAGTTLHRCSDPILGVTDRNFR